MSALSEYAERVTAHLNTIGSGITGVAGDIAALKALIEEIQNTPGSITPEDQAILDQMEALTVTLADQLTALDAENPPPAPPA